MDSKAKVLVNTVNYFGVMEKGIAEIFKKKYPTMFEEYRELCQQKMIHTGILYPYYDYENKELKLLNFPIKKSKAFSIKSKLYS